MVSLSRSFFHPEDLGRLSIRIDSEPFRRLIADNYFGLEIPFHAIFSRQFDRYLDEFLVAISHG